MKRFILFLSSTLVLTCMFAQTDSSSQNVDKKAILSGTVYDTNGSVLVHAHLVARSSRAKEYEATTNAEGSYKLELPVDVYKIEVNATGFCPTTVEMFRVRKSPFRVMPLDVVLEVSEGDRPCKQKTMIKKPEPKVRQPELFRSIAE